MPDINLVYIQVGSLLVQGVALNLQLATADET